jgi:hypothetical protein
MKSIKKQYSNRIEYHNEQGKLHREDGPAIERNDGDKEWYINGLRHREDGPAIEMYNGTLQWWVFGNIHREDGPAIEYPSGHKIWFLDGLEYSEQDWQQEVTKIKLKRILDL